MNEAPIGDENFKERCLSLQLYNHLNERSPDRGRKAP